MFNLKSGAINKKSIKNKRAQLTLFIILAVVLIALALVLIFVFGNISLTKTNEVESYFISCVDDKMKTRVATAELQGGYLELPTFVQGSSNYPFSSYFRFLGLDIPYWAYISGNGIYQMQNQSIAQIESQFSEYLKKAAAECLEFRAYSYLNITHGEVSKSSVKIYDTYIESTLILPIEVSGEMAYRKSEHTIKTKTNFGSLYRAATEIFNAQNKRTILSNYSIDVINAYAPVDGLELSCAPKIWSKTEIINTLKKALQENIQAIKIKGSEYTLKSSKNRYFVADFGQINQQVNFLYTSTWPTKLDVWPSDNDIMRAYPIGNQQGLGIIGFCFIPYHFVYDLSFPVLVQVTSGTEIFQFPILIVIDKMIPQKANLNDTLPIEFDICSTPGQAGTVYTSYNSNPIEADISFRCLSQTCSIGSTKKDGDFSSLIEEFPKCSNGYVIASAQGYKNSEALVSTNEPFIVDIYLSPTYSLDLDLGLGTNENAILIFKSQGYDQTVFYPSQKKIDLSEGAYSVSLQIYKNSELSLGSQEVEKCIKVPAAGIPGTLGFTTEQCYSITIPASQLTSVPIGGGKAEFYATDEELKNSRKIKILSEKLETPNTIEEVMDVYTLINLNTLTITLA